MSDLIEVSEVAIDDYELLVGDYEIGVPPVHLDALPWVKLKLSVEMAMIMDSIMMNNPDSVWSVGIENRVFNYKDGVWL